MSDNALNQALESLAKPGIILQRIHSQSKLRATKSFQGGRPFLPEGVAWPRSRENEPLHFLAQLNCAELPDVDCLLPRNGMLFFFAKVGDELVWGAQITDEFRVLYVDSPGLTTTEIPSDIDTIAQTDDTEFDLYFLKGFRVQSWPYPQDAEYLLGLDSGDDTGKLWSAHGELNKLARPFPINKLNHEYGTCSNPTMLGHSNCTISCLTAEDAEEVKLFEIGDDRYCRFGQSMGTTAQFYISQSDLLARRFDRAKFGFGQN